jgi:hypothetical protein
MANAVGYCFLPDAVKRIHYSRRDGRLASRGPRHDSHPTTLHHTAGALLEGVPKETREAQQPLERKWPFPDEGQEVPQEDGPK